MRPEAQRLLRSLVAAWDLLVLEARFLAGNRGLVLLLLQVAILAATAIAQRYRDDPWDTASFYNRCLVLPGLLPALVLGMSAIMEERDVRHLEVTFGSPGGRYQVWCFRLGAIALALVGATFASSLLVWVFIDRGHEVVAAAAHAIVPLVLVATMTVFFSVWFRGAASAALMSSLVLGVSGLFFHGAPPLRRLDVFLNPFDPPQGLLDPDAWWRLVVFNRSLLLVATSVAFALVLWLLQKRERLV